MKHLASVIASILITTPVIADEPQRLEVMGITPGISTIAAVKEIIGPHAKKIKCKDKKSLSAYECRTKGESDTLTLANHKVTVAFTAPLGSDDNSNITQVTFSFDEQSTFPQYEDARTLVNAFAAKFGNPRWETDCVAEDRPAFRADENSVRTCADWIDESGVKLSILYRVQHDVLSVLGGDGDADHFLQVEIIDSHSLVSDL